MSKKRYIESYKDLCKSTMVISLSMFVLNLLVVFALDNATGGTIGRAIACVLLPHISHIKFISMYVENYKYLVQKQEINDSKKLFWYGMLPLIVEEFLNIVVLVISVCFMFQN